MIGIVSCSSKIILPINYGYLYNYYAVSDVRNIAPLGWHVPTNSDWDILRTPSSFATHFATKTDWIPTSEPGYPGAGAPNVGYTVTSQNNNSTGWSGRPGGLNAGAYQNLYLNGYWWSSTPYTTVGYAYGLSMGNVSWNFGMTFFANYEGFSIRCVKDVQDLSASKVTDIDGNIYDTINIGTQTWMIQNLAVTKYRNGDSITNITDAGHLWINSNNQGAYCAYNNDLTNVFYY